MQIADGGDESGHSHDHQDKTRHIELYEFFKKVQLECLFLHLR